MRRRRHDQGNPNTLISNSVPHSHVPSCAQSRLPTVPGMPAGDTGTQPTEKVLPGDRTVDSTCVERGKAGVDTPLSACGGQAPGREPALQTELDGGQRALGTRWVFPCGSSSAVNVPSPTSNLLKRMQPPRWSLDADQGPLSRWRKQGAADRDTQDGLAWVLFTQRSLASVTRHAGILREVHLILICPHRTRMGQ